VAAEAMMHEVPCIVSDAAGTALYLHNGEDGLVFHKENVEELTEMIAWCIRNRDRLSELGRNSRKIYDKYFSMTVFENRLLKLLKHAWNKKEKV
jgi:glycosyltransferase involved in cell wall biosynthesis